MSTNERERIFLASIGVSCIASFIFFVFFIAAGYGLLYGIEIQNVLVVDLQVNGVLLGFGATLFSYLLKRTDYVIGRWSFIYATSAFMSFFFSILFGFMNLFNPQQHGLLPLLPFCFTLAGIFITIVFLAVVGGEHLKGT